MLSVAIVEDHPVFREALKQLLSKTGLALNSVGFDSFESLKAHLDQNNQTDLVLLDLELPGAQGFTALVHINYHHPHTRVAIVSGHDSPDIVDRALMLGADSFIPKSLSLEDLLEALTSVVSGNRWRPQAGRMSESPAAQKMQKLANKLAGLSPQQRRVVMGMAQGRLNKQIAYELGITEGTVKNHVTSVLRHLGMRRRTEVVANIHHLLNIPETDMMQAHEPH